MAAGLALSPVIVLAIGLVMRSTTVDAVAYLLAYLAAVVLAGIAIFEFLNTDVGMRFALSVGAAVAVPGVGALAFGSRGVRRSLSIGPETANPELFLSFAGIAVAFTLALMLEMRFAGDLPRDLEPQRRMVFRWLCASGGLTAICAAGGFFLLPRLEPHRVADGIGALLGASVDGTLLIGGLVLLLAMVPREGFREAAHREEEQLRAEGRPSRCRQIAGGRYVRRALPATALGTVLIAGAVFVWWLAVPVLLSAGGWLAHTWHPREQTPRADEGLPLDPTTFFATVFAGISLPFVLHAFVPFAEPAHGWTADEIYRLTAGLLPIGYVAFAAGHPSDPRTGLLPSLHTVGRWCGIAALAGLGLGGALFAIAHHASWFTFWIAVTSTPLMFAQVFRMASPHIRRHVAEPRHLRPHAKRSDAAAKLIGHSMRRARQETGLSEAQLAQRLHIGTAHLTSIEAGHTDLTAAQLVSIADALNAVIEITMRVVEDEPAGLGM